MDANHPANGVNFARRNTLCVIITIKRLSGSEPRKGDELATKFGLLVAERISKTFDLQPRPEPTSEERLIAAAVGTAAVIGLGVVAYLLQAALRWTALFLAYGLLPCSSHGPYGVRISSNPRTQINCLEPTADFGSFAPQADVPCGKRSKSVVDEPDENQRELDWL